MLTLGGKYQEINMPTSGLHAEVMKLTENKYAPMALRVKQAFLVKDGADIPDGFAIYIGTNTGNVASRLMERNLPAILLPEAYSYMAEGDVIRFQREAKNFRVIYRKNTPTNYFLLTERCNHYCLMCSQPPKRVDDSWIAQTVLDAIPLIDPDAFEIGLTGGEPTMLENDFFRIIQACKSYLPRTAVHILSNGRRFMDDAFTKQYAAINHPDVMVGIPIYSDISSIHNYVVQAENAFDETIKGILNLKRHNQKVEIRVVLHKQTYERLPQLAEFIARNLLFVDHVTFMGLENTGFTKANMKDLWIDPYDYRDKLYEAVNILVRARVHTSIYNHQLCVIDKRLWGHARKSISDWKNEYLDECASCQQKTNCGGFFSSTLTKHSSHITPQLAS